MAVNLYMSYDHKEEHDDKDYYYFRVGLWQGGLMANLLLLVSGIVSLDLLDLPSAIPKTLAKDLQVRNLDGTLFDIPNDLVLLYVEDMSLSPDILPVDFLDSGFIGQPIAVYKVADTSGYPVGFDPVADKVPNIEGHEHWYFPDAISSQYVGIASRKSSSPFWTRLNFDLLDAYTDGSYNCEGLPYNIHVTCNLAELATFDPPAIYNDYGYFVVNGYYRNIESNNLMWRGGALVYDGSGSVHSLTGEMYRPTYLTDPVVWFYLPEPVPDTTPTGFIPHLFTVLAPLFEFFPVAGYGSLSKFGAKEAAFLRFGNICLTAREFPGFGFMADGVNPFAGETHPEFGEEQG